jgi:hypothetical protein
MAGATRAVGTAAAAGASVDPGAATSLESSPQAATRLARQSAVYLRDEDMVYLHNGLERDRDDERLLSG